MVAIHQPVLKSTTSARGRDAKKWMVALVCLVHLVGLVRPERPNRPNRPDRPDKPQFASSGGSELPFSLALMYSHRMMRGERP
jgi:hypothetical protein